MEKEKLKKIKELDGEKRKATEKGQIILKNESERPRHQGQE
ncbi:hypothetical protein [Allomuricauda sp. CAU 1633]|nr:hypothetical protein [Muricauda sp. CAU 1633]